MDTVFKKMLGVSKNIFNVQISNSDNAEARDM